MFCIKCGKEIQDGQTFCTYCGARQSEEAKPREQMTWEAPGMMQGKDEREKAVTEKAVTQKQETRKSETEKSGTKKKRRGIIAIVVAALLVIGAGAGCILYFTGDSYACKKSMKLAEEYFADEDYEEALACYEDALKIDNTLTEAYLGAADACLAQENYEDALEMLQKGLKRSRSDREAREILEEKLMETYLTATEGYFDQGNFERAYSLAQEGIEEIEDASFQRKLLQKQEEIRAVDITGIYKLQSVEMAGVTVNMEDLASSLQESLDDLRVDLELGPDGKFKFDLTDLDASLVMEGTYEVSGSTMILTDETGEEITAILEGGTITMSEEAEGVTASMTFKKKQTD